MSPADAVSVRTVSEPPAVMVPSIRIVPSLLKSVWRSASVTIVPPAGVAGGVAPEAADVAGSISELRPVR